MQIVVLLLIKASKNLFSNLATFIDRDVDREVFGGASPNC